ncbi:hypothetical protein NHH88_15530 [Oxalobacteraceae bacterium OTU3CAMAD1]|nr:hypothetical protein NHH88_15530 [Oxalobacteraceae bacterium OTU3CAMAD1]
MELINYASAFPSHLRSVHADNIVQYANTMRHHMTVVRRHGAMLSTAEET